MNTTIQSRAVSEKPVKRLSSRVSQRRPERAPVEDRGRAVVDVSVNSEFRINVGDDREILGHFELEKGHCKIVLPEALEDRFLGPASSNYHAVVIDVVTNDELTPDDTDRGAVTPSQMVAMLAEGGFEDRIRDARRQLSGQLPQGTLRELRLRAGLSQTELAARIGATQPQISRMESEPERENPTVDRIAKLSAVLGCDWNTLRVALRRG